MKTRTIVGVDLSFREAGVAKIHLDIDKNSSSIRLEEFYPIKTPSDKSKSGIHAINYEYENLDKIISMIRKTCQGATDLDIEIPTGKATKMSSHASGVCLAVSYFLRSDFEGSSRTRLPSALKKWSESKRGDKKKKVREEVYKRFGSSVSNNDNVIDALGLCLIRASEIVTEERSNKER